MDQNFPAGECTCNSNEGYCVYPLYSSQNIVEINFYQGYDCNSNTNVEYNQQFHLNTCNDGTFLTGHHDDHYHPAFAIVSSICSIIFCIVLFCFFRYCCCRPPVVVMAPVQPQVVQMVPMQQQVQMVPMQPQVQMVNGQMVPMQQQPNYEASSAPSGEAVQAFSAPYPNLNSAPQSAV